MQDAPYMKVPVKAGEGTVYALVDAEDFGRIAAYKWRLWSGYPVTTVGRHIKGECTIFQMGREVLGLTKGDGLEADHINHDPLDNRRENLRAVTHARNMRNSPSRGGTSQYRGVSWVTRDKRWAAQAKFDKKHYALGHYHDEREAARAVNRFWLSMGHEPPNKIA